MNFKTSYQEPPLAPDVLTRGITCVSTADVERSLSAVTDTLFWLPLRPEVRGIGKQLLFFWFTNMKELSMSELEISRTATHLVRGGTLKPGLCLWPYRG